MHLALTVFLVLAGFAGFFFGVVPTIVLCCLATLGIIGAWILRPASQRRREDHLRQRPTG